MKNSNSTTIAPGRIDATPNDIIGRLERHSGVKLAKAFSIPDLDREVKVALQICPPKRHPRVAHFHD
jgi:hypothetical protein